MRKPSGYIQYNETWPGSQHYLILFVLWPFLALITALSNYQTRTAKRVVYLFLIYYGLSYFISPESLNDAARYSLTLKANAAMPFREFFKIVGGLYSSDTSVDFIEPLISFIVSRFTDNYAFLFGAYAALFGFFYLKSIDILHNRYIKNPGWNSLVHMIFFAAILPVTAINGFRMWTAAWIFFYGAYFIITERDPRYFLVTFFAALVHWSFLTVNVLLLIYFFAGNRNIFYLPLALVSFVLPHYMNRFFSLVALRLGGALESRYYMYSDQAYVDVVQNEAASLSWFMKIGYNLVFFYLLGGIVVARLMSRKWPKEKAQENMYSFLLLLLAFVNFGMGIPSLGNRYQIIFFIFATLYLFMFMVRLPDTKLNILTIIGLFPMLLYTAIVFRQGSDSLNAWLFTPGLGIPLLVPGVSVASLLF